MRSQWGNTAGRRRPLCCCWPVRCRVSLQGRGRQLNSVHVFVCLLHVLRVSFQRSLQVGKSESGLGPPGLRIPGGRAGARRDRPRGASGPGRSFSAVYLRRLERSILLIVLLTDENPIYIYIYIYIHIYIYIYIGRDLSLSLSVYIYIYIYRERDR